MSSDTKYADPEDAREYAATAKKAFVQCRRYGHSWGPHDASPMESGCDEEISKCRVCRALRKEILDASGDVQTRSIVYPDGYLMEPGTGRIAGAAKGVFRRAMLDRAYDQKGTGRRR